MSDTPESPPGGDSPIIDRDGHLDAGSLGRVVWITDVGHARSRNEDRLLVQEAFGSRFLLLVVADGAGGHNRGDKAATTVALALAEAFSAAAEPPDGPPAAWLNDVILAAHSQVIALAKGESRPPAATLVGLLVERDTLCAWRFHVGDSRIYGRKGTGNCLPWTRDHNITNGLIDRGLPVTQAMKIAEGGKLTQVMGGGTQPEPEIRGPFQLSAGWSFLLCSDGVYGYNDDRNVIGPALDPDVDLAQRAATLKEAILAGDALDNLTAVLWDVPPQADAIRQRLGLVEPYDAADVGTMVGMPVHAAKGADGPGPTGPPPPSSMPNIRSIEDDDIARAQAKLKDVPAATAAIPAEGAPAKEELERAQEALDHARRGSAGLAFGVLLLIALIILAIVGAMRSRSPGERLTVEEMEAQRVQARFLAGETPASEPTAAPAPRAPADEPVQASLDRLVGGMDRAWWQGLGEDRRDELLSVLRDLLGPISATPQRLTWEAGDPAVRHSHELADWRAPGGENAAVAATAWAARGRILGLHGDLASQPGMADALRDAACDQVRLRWPRGNATDPGDGLELGSWLAACLPVGVDGASVAVKLGAWPDVGWRPEDVAEVERFAGMPDGATELLRFEYSWNARIVELAQLAAALASPGLHDVKVELAAVFPAGDGAAAARLADQLGGLLRAATHGSVEIDAVGGDEPSLLPATAREGLLPGQLAKVEGLERRVEVTVFRASPLELDEEDGEELPGEPDVTNAPDASP